MRHWASLSTLVCAGLVSGQAVAQAAPAASPDRKAQANGSPASTAVEGITVTAAPQALQTSIDKRSYGVASDLQTATGSVADALRNIPSVTVDVQGALSLRGDANVTVMIDGKPSGQFRGPGAAEALQSMPADQIERVEVITNPSAAYGVDGSAGIINLITKKNRKLGATGSLRGNAGSGARYNLGGGAAYKSGKLSTSADVSFRRQPVPLTIADDRVSPNPGDAALVATSNHLSQRGRTETGSGRGSADYDWDDKIRFGAELRFTASDYATTATDRLLQTGAAAAAYDRSSRVIAPRINAALTGTLTRKFNEDGRALVITASAERTRNKNDRRLVTAFSAPRARIGVQDFTIRAVQDQRGLKADYTRPATGRGVLKAGYEFQSDDNRYDNSGRAGASVGAVMSDPALSDRFIYEQSVHALYGSYEAPIGGLAAQGALRLESADIDTEQVASGLRRSRHQVAAYPSLHLSYGWASAKN